jgi:signal peptidase I
MATPPPLKGYLPPKVRMQPFQVAIIVAALAIATLIACFVLLRLFGLIRPFGISTGGMAPAISSGDHVLMEGLSYLRHKPRRGDIMVFRTDGMPSVPSGQIYVKRLAASPGEHVSISNGKLYVNNSEVKISKQVPEINYQLPAEWASTAPNMDVNVGEGHYYVLGDRATNSLDSRYFGCVPAKNVLGRIAFCYWPPSRMGPVK